MRLPGPTAVLAAIGSVILRLARWKRPFRGWRGEAGQAVNTCQHLYDRLAADLAAARFGGRTPSSLGESLRLVDVLAGRLAELASGPGYPQIQAALADLRDEVERLRTCLQSIGASGAGPAGDADQARAVKECGRQLVVFETALRTFRDRVGPPVRRRDAQYG
jgi:hypothetical protein